MGHRMANKLLTSAAPHQPHANLHNYYIITVNCATLYNQGNGGWEEASVKSREKEREE
jgi:hypothetical protein